MKSFLFIRSILVCLQCFWFVGEVTGRRSYEVQPVCQRYRGTFCAKYLKGRKIYLTRSQKAGENRVKQVYNLLRDRINTRCMKYSLPTLCYSMLPPCDPTSRRPKKREICREDCSTLQNDVCKWEFIFARKHLKKYTRNCFSLPARGQPGYKQCLRIMSKALSLTASVQNISMYEGKSVTLKCRLSSKKIPFNVTWLKDGAPINQRFKIKKFRWGSRLRVRHVRLEDDGKYQCFVTAKGRTLEAVGWLNIRRTDYPKVTTDPTNTNDITSHPQVSTNKPNRGKYPRCVPYRGKMCKEFMSGDLVFAYTAQGIESIELDYAGTLEGIRAAPHMTNSCRKYAIRALCYHIFKTCDPKEVEGKPKLCREDCFSLYDDVCASELAMARREQRIASLLPNCSRLPTKTEKDRKFCTSLDINENVYVPPIIDNSFLSHLEKSKDENCYNKTGSDYLGRHNVTKSGHFCKRWGLYDPVYNFSHNFCRNPRNHRESPWCYVSDTEYDLCDLPKCSDAVLVVDPRPIHKRPRRFMTVQRTIYVICAIMGILVAAFIAIIVYLKIQERLRNSLAYRDNSSSGSISKSTQSTVHQPSNDFKQSLMDVKSCCFNVVDDCNQGKVKFLEVLGEGAFARVCKGVLMNEFEESDIELAIKKLKSNAPDKVVENFRNETNVLADLQDINILCLVGVSVVNPYFMVFEYYGNTDLRVFLSSYIHAEMTGDVPTDPDEVLLLDLALQVASGLDYLIEKHFVHRDIACRNCYITNERIVKISNLGIGNTKYPCDYSWVHGSSLLPVRWMAPEALNTLQCTHQSDIWSYGVLLWEIYTYGLQPYTAFNNQEAIERIRRMEILPCPESCPARIYALMKECWEEKAWDRPSSIDICSRLRAWAGDSIGENH